MDSIQKIWLLSAYHSGSHRAWAEGYASLSAHRVRLITMAGRFWKWRMQGGAIELARQARVALRQERPTLLLATDMVNLTAWLGLMRSSLPGRVPVALYMHENQLTYPWRPGEPPDLTYAMINWQSQLAADHVLFNSHYHLRAWFEALPNLLKHFPDYTNLDMIESVRSRSSVLPLGIHLAPESAEQRDQGQDASPLIVWNQRWEYDKCPERFFSLLYRLDAAGADFRLAVAGENFRKQPDEFEKARTRLAHRIVHWGYLPDRSRYRRLLCQADLVISTAVHEFFGLSILEAIAAGAFPLLPNRLSYPELIPPALHPACLYGDEEELYQMALHRLRSPRPAPPSLLRHVWATYSWPAVARSYDRFFSDLALRPPSAPPDAPDSGPSA